MNLSELGEKAKKAAQVLATSTESQKNELLLLSAESLINNADAILSANKKDIDIAVKNGMKPSLVDRLSLNMQRIEDMAKGLSELASAPDPVGQVVDGVKISNGLNITKVAVPLGVIGIIYEARPNVTADAFGICLKAGNAVILRGGKEAINTNKKTVEILSQAVKKCGFPDGTVQLVEDTTRESSTALMKLKDLDLLIPRGGASLIKATLENATVPVIETGVGNCHTFVDKSADITMAADIVENAKCSRPSVCNALETLLVHEDIAPSVLPVIFERLKKHNVEIRGCERTLKILPGIIPATDEDYATEFLDYILAVKVVKDLDAAIEHIRKYSTGHSECIVTDSFENSERFLNELDAAVLYVNASTRFTDGGQFGMGAEIGISTGKLHARGPMGVKDLTTVKYVVRGNGQIR